jgi:DNA end-binding protein Ku
LLHEKCGSRVRNQYYCPVRKVMLERDDLIGGFQRAKDQYVQITEEELDSLEAEANNSIDLKEFIPLPRTTMNWFCPGVNFSKAEEK